MLSYETFLKGIAVLQNCYRGFELKPEVVQTWYAIIKLVISEDVFSPMILEYCSSKPAPTCPADLINFSRQRIIDEAPSASSFTYMLIESTRQMYLQYQYDELSDADMKDYVIADVSSRMNPKFSQVIITIVNEFIGPMVNVIRYNDRTEISILESAIRRYYQNALNRWVSSSVMTASLLEFKASLLPQG